MHDLLVDVDGRQGDSALLRFAFSLARQHRASITGLQVVALDALVLALPEALLVLEDEVKQAWERQHWWKALCDQHGVRGSWEVERGFYQSVMARRAVLSDVVLGGLDHLGASTSNAVALVNRSVLAEAIPMLLVPDEWMGSGRVRRVLIAWNGSVEGARAVRASYPILARASQVIVLDGEAIGHDTDDGSTALLSPLPLRGWLERRGVHTHWQPCVESHDTGRFILEVAKEREVDLIVMGAWGHLRIGEWLLGGVTRYVLGHSRFPLLLAH